MESLGQLTERQIELLVAAEEYATAKQVYPDAYDFRPVKFSPEEVLESDDLVTRFYSVKVGERGTNPDTIAGFCPFNAIAYLAIRSGTIDDQQGEPVQAYQWYAVIRKGESPRW